MPRMTDATLLLEQARRLRTLAPGFDQAILRRDVLKLSESCEELARAMLPGLVEEVSKPTNALLEDLYVYWRGQRGSRIAPPGPAIRIEDLARLTPRFALIDVVGDPPRFRVRQCGARVAKAYGEDVTGKFLDELDLGSISRQTADLYDRIVRERRAQVIRARFTKQRDERYFNIERIGLPLSEDGKAVDMIFCAYAYHWE